MFRFSFDAIALIHFVVLMVIATYVDLGTVRGYAAYRYVIRAGHITGIEINETR